MVRNTQLVGKNKDSCSPQAIVYLGHWKLENCEPTFDEDCAGMRILCIFNESVLLFSKNMLTHYTSIAQNIRGQALNRIHSLASTCKNKTLHVPSLGPSQSNYLPSTRETKIVWVSIQSYSHEST